MKIKVVRIGNSRGIRIPKPLLEQAGLSDEVNIEVVENRLVISSTGTPRTGWEEAFRSMSQVGDDGPVYGEALPATRFETDEWEW